MVVSVMDDGDDELSSLQTHGTDTSHDAGHLIESVDVESCSNNRKHITFASNEGCMELS